MSDSNSATEQISRLAELKKAGALTEDEFNTLKAQIISANPPQRTTNARPSTQPRYGFGSRIAPRRNEAIPTSLDVRPPGVLDELIGHFRDLFGRVDNGTFWGESARKAGKRARGE